ncbi:MAG: hypothetical protein KAQ92_05990, partial [Candidatus Aenigmarchaeota archaeon]|nr:hypothetical protein [Candidatus Aenigmarchaeota archaeon]
VMFSGIDLPEKTIKQQIASAVNMIVQASRLSDGSRRVTYITEITGMEGNIITMQDIFKWEQFGIDEEGRVIGCHTATGVRPKFAEKCKAKGVKLPLEIFDTNAPVVYLCSNPPNKKIEKKNEKEQIPQNTFKDITTNEQKKETDINSFIKHRNIQKNPI